MIGAGESAAAAGALVVGAPVGVVGWAGVCVFCPPWSFAPDFVLDASVERDEFVVLPEDPFAERAGTAGGWTAFTVVVGSVTPFAASRDVGVFVPGAGFELVPFASAPFIARLLRVESGWEEPLPAG